MQTDFSTEDQVQVRDGATSDPYILSDDYRALIPRRYSGYIGKRAREESPAPAREDVGGQDCAAGCLVASFCGLPRCYRASRRPAAVRSVEDLPFDIGQRIPRSECFRLREPRGLAGLSVVHLRPQKASQLTATLPA